jgi:hypothetical protein
MSAYTNKHTPIVKELLLQRVDLTHQTLIDLGHGWRLSAVIYSLRCQEWPIDTLLDHKRIAHYRLKAGWQPPQAANLGGIDA